MITNYFKTAWRNLMKKKAFSFINILGLTIGITVCLMIFVYIVNEFSVDRFHVNNDRIYRVMRGVGIEGGQQSIVAYLSGPYAPALTNDFSEEIEEIVRVNPTEGLVTIGDRSFREKRIYDVDSNFFNLFSFPLVQGDATTALSDPTSVVLTESTAKKYFGSADKAMNQLIELDKALQLRVTAIAKDVPSNSHLEFDLLVPLANYQASNLMNVWINNGLYTYVRLAPNVTEGQLENRFPEFMEKYMGRDMKEYGYRFSLSLTPLKDVYFERLSFDQAKHGDKQVVYIFISVALLILLIGCINYVNLSVVQSVDRSKEVGLRKVLGAQRKGLVWQFIGESVLLTSVSCILSIGLLTLLLPGYNQLLGYPLTVNWRAWPIWTFLAGIVVVVGFLAGSYPALFLSSFSPVQALKGKLRVGKGGTVFREGLVIFQFCISIFLIIGTIVIAKQLHYVKNKQLGYHAEQVVIVRIDNDDFYVNRNRFKNALQGEPSVASVSLMSGEPGGFFDGQMFEVEEHTEKRRSRSEFADFEFVETMGLTLIAGRDLSPEYPTDSTAAALINRTAAASFGWTPEQAIGKWIRNTIRDSERRHIVGVVEDFNFLSLKENIEPLIIAPYPDHRVALVKTIGGNIKQSLASIKQAYEKAAPGYPFAYEFLDQQFDELYRTDLRQQRLLTIFAGLAIFIACLGLFGLASFTTVKRFKEIGVRKVLGSSVTGIVVLLTRGLLRPVLVATCIVIPASYLAMNHWLRDFAYRTTLDWWVFALAAVVTFIIALLTVGMQALKAAIANPVDSLRDE